MAKKQHSRRPEAKRSPGHPKPSQPVVTPDVIERIGDGILAGKSNRAIAKGCGIDEKTVRNVLANILRPQWEQEAQAERAVQMAKINRLEAFAWDRLQASTEPQTRKQITRQITEALGGQDGEGGEDKAAAGEIVKRVLTKIKRTGEPCWSAVIQWCADYRARVFGYYAPTRHTVEMEDLRVAGSDREALDKEMVQRLKEKVRQRQAYRAAMGKLAAE